MLDFIFKVVSFLIAWLLTALVETNFFRMGEPQPLHQNDAYGLSLFHVFNKSRPKSLTTVLQTGATINNTN
jgi:hypothetical protein